TLYLTACSLANLDAKTAELQFEFIRAVSDATKAAWLEERRVDEWHPGMTSGTGWVTKYTATPLGKRQVQRVDAAQPEPHAIQPVKPAARVDTAPFWVQNRSAPKTANEPPKTTAGSATPQNTNTAIAAVRN